MADSGILKGVQIISWLDLPSPNPGFIYMYSYVAKCNMIMILIVTASYIHYIIEIGRVQYAIAHTCIQARTIMTINNYINFWLLLLV